MNIFRKIKSYLFKKDDKKDAQAVNSTNICTGVVKFFNYSRGYGFIDSKAFERRVFLHISDLDSRVVKGQKVKFVVEKTSKGLRAKNVEIAGS